MKKMMILFAMMILVVALITGCNTGKRLDSLESRMMAAEQMAQTTGQDVVKNSDRLDQIYRSGADGEGDTGLLSRLVSATVDISTEVTSLRGRVDHLDGLKVEDRLVQLDRRTNINRHTTAQNRGLIDFGPETKMVSVFFRTGSTCLEKSLKYVQEIVAAGEMELASSVIVGYADQTGSLEKNQVLSLARAEAVKKALADAGVDVSNIKVQAGGPTQAFSFGTERNRRAVIYAQPKKPVPVAPSVAAPTAPAQAQSPAVVPQAPPSPATNPVKAPAQPPTQ